MPCLLLLVAAGSLALLLLRDPRLGYVLLCACTRERDGERERERWEGYISRGPASSVDGWILSCPWASVGCKLLRVFVINPLVSEEMLLCNMRNA